MWLHNRRAKGHITLKSYRKFKTPKRKQCINEHSIINLQSLQPCEKWLTSCLKTFKRTCKYPIKRINQQIKQRCHKKSFISQASRYHLIIGRGKREHDIPTCKQAHERYHIGLKVFFMEFASILCLNSKYKNPADKNKHLNSIQTNALRNNKRLSVS